MSKKKTNAEKDGPSKAVTTNRPKPKKAPARAGTVVFQVNITLNDIRPPIWRRVQTKDCNLATLHDIIQTCMGWDDDHLHVFEIGGEQYGAPEQWDQPGGLGEPEVSSSRKIKLSQLLAEGVKKFSYTYDIGDNWDHTILIEKTLPAEPGIKYPRCIDGKRACPPEDCGGAWGYGDFVEAVQNPKHPEHGNMLEWVGGEFDPEKFDLKAVNEELQGVG